MIARDRLLDLDHLDLYVADDRALRDEVLGIFKEQTEMWVAYLDPTADDAAWREAAHALKGAARGVGAWKLGDMCAQAEDLVGPSRCRRAAFIAILRETAGETIAEVRRLRDRARP